MASESVTRAACVIVYLPEGRVTKVNCWVVARATTTSVQKSIPTETCRPEIACISYLVFFSHSARCFLFDAEKADIKYRSLRVSVKLAYHFVNIKKKKQ